LIQCCGSEYNGRRVGVDFQKDDLGHRLFQAGYSANLACQAVHFTVIQIKLGFPVALQFRDFLGLERLGRCECLSRGDMPLAGLSVPGNIVSSVFFRVDLQLRRSSLADGALPRNGKRKYRVCRPESRSNSQ
jgi:hypothetical protein